MVLAPRQKNFHTRNGNFLYAEKSPNFLDSAMLQSTGSDREAEKKYYESLLVARIARLKEEHKNDKSNKEKIDELSKSLADHKNKYEQAKKKLENFTETFPKRNESLQNHIISLYKTLDEMNEDQKDVEKKIGLTGSTLMACLLSIQRYARQIKKGSNAYSPFVSILNGKLNHMTS